METKPKRKESILLAQMPLIKSVGAANQPLPAIPPKFVALYQRNTKIRMRSEERNENNINNQWVASFTGPRVAFKKVELWENYHNHFSYSLEKNDLYHKL